MKVIIELDELNYDELIDVLLPVLKKQAEESGNLGLKMLSGVLNMPGDIPHKMLGALSQEKKNEILEYLMVHNKEKIKEKLEESLKKTGISAGIRDVNVSFEL